MKRKSRCGDCFGCLTSDCLSCKFCLDMKKYGGPGQMKQACSKRICENMRKAKKSLKSSHGIPLNLSSIKRGRGRPPKNKEAFYHKQSSTSTAKLSHKIQMKKQKNVDDLTRDTSEEMPRKRGRSLKKMIPREFLTETVEDEEEVTVEDEEEVTVEDEEVMTVEEDILDILNSSSGMYGVPLLEKKAPKVPIKETKEIKRTSGKSRPITDDRPGTSGKSRPITNEPPGTSSQWSANHQVLEQTHEVSTTRFQHLARHEVTITPVRSANGSRSAQTAGGTYRSQGNEPVNQRGGGAIRDQGNLSIKIGSGDMTVRNGGPQGVTVEMKCTDVEVSGPADDVLKVVTKYAPNFGAFK